LLGLGSIYSSNHALQKINTLINKIATTHTANSKTKYLKSRF